VQAASEFLECLADEVPVLGRDGLDLVEDDDASGQAVEFANLAVAAGEDGMEQLVEGGDGDLGLELVDEVFALVVVDFVPVVLGAIVEFG